jgi:hypothetical protein
MAKRAPSSQPRTRRTRTPGTEAAAQAADTAVASTTELNDAAGATNLTATTDDLVAADTGPNDMSPETDLDEQPSSSAPSEEDIRTRAYHRYLERGGGHGEDFDDWLEAERELKNGRRG